MDGAPFVFGSFRLLPEQRLLLDGEKPLPLGSRALDILIALAERAGETIRKDELIARAWPDTIVEEGALRVHVAALRKALGDGRDGKRCIANIPGRGYSFVAPVIREHGQKATASLAQARASGNLPVSLTGIVGRDETVAALAAQLARRRLLTIVGPGGIGKTTVAIAIAETVSAAHADGVWFVGLASVAEPEHVASALGAVFGIILPTGNPVSGLAAWLRDKRALVVLDNCEHVINAVAAIAEVLLRAAPLLRLLATSREPLRAEGEGLHRLASLVIPPEGADLTAGEALRYSAVQLFTERVMAIVDGFALTDDDVPAVLEICRRLDGVPLALELAAARVDAFGLAALAARLDDRFALLSKGRRTALPRQQTLRATMDWSFTLLPHLQQVILRRLAVFRGDFTMDAAASVTGDAAIAAGEVIDAVAELAAKSLLATDISGNVAYHRLLETTRVYALARLTERGELQEFSRRHAEYYRGLLERIEEEWERKPAHLADVNNVRAALEWCFSVNGIAALGQSRKSINPRRLEQAMIGDIAADVGGEQRFRRKLGDCVDDFASRDRASPVTEAAASIVKSPRNTARRRRMTCCKCGNRVKFQSIVAAASVDVARPCAGLCSTARSDRRAARPERRGQRRRPARPRVRAPAAPRRADGRSPGPPGHRRRSRRTHRRSPSRVP